MIHGKINSFKGNLYFKKPHNCPKCNIPMEIITIKKVLNPDSPEAKQHSFRLTYGTHLEGNIEFSWKELKCPTCKLQLTMDEMQKMEFEALDNKQQLSQEKREKMKVTLFAMGMIVFALILIICLFSK